MSKSISIAIWGIVLTGIVFKLLHWPGANMMLIVGAGSLAIDYLISAFWNNYVNVSSANRVKAYLQGVAKAVVVLGVLFKVMHWPNSQEILIAGLSISAISLLTSFFDKSEE